MHLYSLLCVFCVAVVPSSLAPSISSTSALPDAGTEVTPEMSPNQGDGFPSPHHHSEGSSSSRPLPHNSHNMSSSASPLLSSPQVHPRLQPPGPVRPAFHPSHRRASEPQLPSSSRSSTLHQESSSRNKGTVSPSLLKKAPVKEMWEDVSVLPRIPKIKRDNVGLTNGAVHRNSSSSNPATNSRGYGIPGTGMNSFSGDKGRQQSVDQHKGRNEGQARRPRPDTAASSSSSSSSSSAFSNSFSSSSSSAASGQYQSSSSSSSSSAAAAAVSFRINSSGNSWHSRRLNAGPPSSSSSRSTVPDVEKDREEAVRKRQLRRDKQMLLASRTLGGNREEDSNSMYDPFNPTLSESCSSDEEAESTSLDNSSQCTTQDEEASSLVKEELEAHNSDGRFCVANETHNRKIFKEEPSGAGAQRAASPVSSPPEHATVTRESGQDDSGTDKQTLWSIKVKMEPSSHSTPERKVITANAQTGEAKVNVDCSLVKDERKTGGEQNGSHDAPSAAPVICKTEPSASTPVPTKKKCKTETKRDSKSPLKDLRRGQEAPQESSSSESDRRRRKEPRSASDQGRQLKENKDEQPSSKRHRRRVRSSSGSSHSDSSDGEHRRKQRARSRSRSRERRRSRYFWL